MKKLNTCDLAKYTLNFVNAQRFGIVQNIKSFKSFIQSSYKNYLCDTTYPCMEKVPCKLEFNGICKLAATFSYTIDEDEQTVTVTMDTYSGNIGTVTFNIEYDSEVFTSETVIDSTTIILGYTRVPLEGDILTACAVVTDKYCRYTENLAFQF